MYSLKVLRTFPGGTAAAVLSPSPTCGRCNIPLIMTTDNINILRSAMSTSSMNTASDEYQFMQQSKLPTMHFQRSLPRLPIPQLEKTCERFLNAVQPILTTDDYNQTCKVIQEFAKHDGPQLQELLKANDASNKHTSYISEPWFNMYLSDRAPLPLNYNPLLVWKQEERIMYSTQLVRATNIVISSMRFWRSLQTNRLEPEVYHLNPSKSDTEEFRKWMSFMPAPIATYAAYAFKAFPLDMSQYERLFGVSRIPELRKDRLVQCRDARHVLVMRRGNMYAVDVLDTDGKIEDPLVIMGRLQRVFQLDSKLVDQATENALPLGVLTAGERNLWARTRKQLEEVDDHNKRLLREKVDSALFCLCLDGPGDPVYNDTNPLPSWRNLLAGDGRNRWFDKSLSVIIDADGCAAVNFEHSWGDGVAVLRYFNEIYKETTAQPFVSTSTVAETINDGVEPLIFRLDSRINRAIQEAITHNNTVMDGLEMQMTRYGELSKQICKEHGISPDSMMQLAFQLAHRQGFGQYVGSYESCSTAAFRHGRTETMRPCTMATKEFCELILQNNSTATSSELYEVLRKCSRIHGQLTKEAAMGQGFDRHLFALKHIATAVDRPIPSLYETEAYRKLNYNIISTSTLSSDALLAGAFGPVVRDGFGIGYSIQNAECGAIVTSYKEHGKGQCFMENLEKAFIHIGEVLKINTKSAAARKVQ